mmetsp:Transcript_10598/g.41185  ORF Transcript_10598/g.41185 Transcript_10598/m.41185 type:complete len:222 (-) Transcript_10598:661-1326(-)
MRARLKIRRRPSAIAGKDCSALWPALLDGSSVLLAAARRRATGSELSSCPAAAGCSCGKCDCWPTSAGTSPNGSFASEAPWLGGVVTGDSRGGSILRGREASPIMGAGSVDDITRFAPALRDRWRLWPSRLCLPLRIGCWDPAERSEPPALDREDARLPAAPPETDLATPSNSDFALREPPHRSECRTSSAARSRSASTARTSLARTAARGETSPDALPKL